MRFIGSKRLLLDNIENIINENTSGKEKVFCDIFSGTGIVAKHFKPKYEVHSNDILYFSYIIQKAIIENNTKPLFEELKKINIIDPFDFLENTKIEASNYNSNDNFIAKNYSPHDDCKRMYLTNDNAIRIDFIRNTIEKWKTQKKINTTEYYYLLAGLIEGVPCISNIAGTYGAYLKQWDKRAFKTFEMKRLDVINNNNRNRVYNIDANKLICEIEGDILYIDPPYNSRQYESNYHLLETISKYDQPEIYGISGLRPYNKSSFCIKNEVLEVFNDLIEKAKFTNIFLSYSTDGLMSFEKIENILKKYGIEETYKSCVIPYRKYKSNNKSKTNILNEYLFYIKKNIKRKVFFDFIKENTVNYNYKVTEEKYIKSPLNYIGGKYKLLPQIMPFFPNNINTFVDLFCGGCNVSININAKNIICNDINSKIIGLFEAFKTFKIDDIINQIEKNIVTYNLSKENKEGFEAFREYYNKMGNSIDLYTLICYSFNYQIRFNNNLEYNNPFGKNRSQFSDNMKNNLYNFVRKVKSINIEFLNKDFTSIIVDSLNKNDIIYCDPPYLIAAGTYNDGKRGFKSWKEEQEYELYDYLDRANKQNIKFALSNVLEHKGKINKILTEWCKKYRVINLNYNYSNSSYNTREGESREVLIVNY